MSGAPLSCPFGYGSQVLQTAERVPLVPAAYSGVEPGSPEAYEVLGSYREAFYDRGSELIQAHADKLLAGRADRPPFGLTDIRYPEKGRSQEYVVEEIRSYYELDQAVGWTGLSGVRRFMEGARQDPAYNDTLTEFDTLTALFYGLARTADTGKPIRMYKSAEKLLLSGQNTGSLVTVGALQSIGEVVNARYPAATAKRTAAIAGASVRLATKPAVTGINNTRYTLNAISTFPARDRFQLMDYRFARPDPKLLTIKPAGDGECVDYILPFKEHVDPYLNQKIGDIPTLYAVLGCPALKGAVIKKLWQWNVDVAYQAGLWGPPG
jgi:hypothetical protein